MHTDYRSPAPVALTFDNGPDPIWTPLVFDALASVGVRATFFVVAPTGRTLPFPYIQHAGERPRRRLSLRRARQPRRHDAEGDRNRRRLRTPGAGTAVRYWRAPWGLITPATEEVANKYRLLLVGWAADTEDWRGGTPEEMLARIRGRISGIASSGGESHTRSIKRPRQNSPQPWRGKGARLGRQARSSLYS